MLLAAIDKYIDQNSITILDGHFCLLNSNHEITKIPKATFEGILPIAIIVLHDSISNISNKITNRDGVSYDINLLSSFQNEEMKYSADIADDLQIPFLLFDVSGDMSEMVNFIDCVTDRKVK